TGHLWPGESPKATVMPNFNPTDDELADLIGLYVDDALTESLRIYVEERAAADPAIAREITTLCAARDQIRGAAQPTPDPWFTERALESLLRANGRAATTF